MDATTDRVMIDIETLGTAPGAPILSIGAIEFGPNGLDETFYEVIDLQSCLDKGLDNIDADTFEWWLTQSEEAQAVLTGGDHLTGVLRRFSRFMNDVDEVWASPTAFDCTHIEHAYRTIDTSAPWKYNERRDCKLLSTLPVWPDTEQEGIEHHALDDACHQAKQTIKALTELDERL